MHITLKMCRKQGIESIVQCCLYHLISRDIGASEILYLGASDGERLSWEAAITSSYFISSGRRAEIKCRFNARRLQGLWNKPAMSMLIKITGCGKTMLNPGMLKQIGLHFNGELTNVFNRKQVDVIVSTGQQVPFLYRTSDGASAWRPINSAETKGKLMVSFVIAFLWRRLAHSKYLSLASAVFLQQSNADGDNRGSFIVCKRRIYSLTC